MLETVMKIIKFVLIGNFIFSLICVSQADIKTRTIPDIWCGAIMLNAWANVVCGGIHWTTSAISCVAIGAITLTIAIIKDDFLGGGDVKLCAATAAFSGGDVFLFALTVGLVVAIFLHRKEKTTIPLAPYLTIGYGAYYLIKILKGVI